MSDDVKKAVDLLKNAVKDSHLNNQKHIDLSLIDAKARIDYQKALVVVQNAIKNGDKTETEIKHELGLI
mgnify:CR=1 FL=1